MEPARRADSPALTITRVLPVSREAVFAAWTTAASVRQWMCPKAGSAAVVELDVRAGGTFRVDMIVDGERTVHTGVYREVAPPERLAFTWMSRHTRGRATLVTVQLRALGEHTELTLTQTGLPDEDAVHGHTRGWTEILEHLAAFVQTTTGP